VRAEILRRAAELAERGEPYALATVVRREPASSARLGDAALIAADGTFHGWIGGMCTRPTITREALAALADGEARLIALDPDPGVAREPGIRVLPMTCHSGGSVDIYVEPILPAPTLYALGATPAARTLARLAKTMGYAVVAVDPEADEHAFPDADRVAEALDPEAEPPAGASGRYVVVATQGQWDEEAIHLALRLDADYVGLVASPRRFEEVRASLAGRGEAADALEAVDSPAGIDIGAVDPEEIALSVMAGIVRHRREKSPEVESSGEEPSGPEPAIDPVCGMEVVPVDSTPSAGHEGVTYHFCCGGCRDRFAADPASYVEPAGTAE